MKTTIALDDASYCFEMFGGKKDLKTTPESSSSHLQNSITAQSLFTYGRLKEMSRRKMPILACHVVACLLFPVITSLGLHAYTNYGQTPSSTGVAAGLAVQLIFGAFVFINGLMVISNTIRTKLILISALVVAILFYLFPQHPLRAVFFATISSALTLSAAYIAERINFRGVGL